MHLQVYHRTRYAYPIAVTDSHTEMRLRSATDDADRLSFFLLKVQPPRRLRHFRDDAMNYVHWFDLNEPHTELIMEATSHVNTTTQYAGGKPLGIGFDKYENEQMDQLRGYLTSSRFVDVSQDVWQLARQACDSRADVFEAAQAIMELVNREWSYVPSATHAGTHMRDVMVDRRGVCQDFTHVMLGMCRSLGIPARYVSGYLYNGPLGTLRGAQASHAWCEIWLPGRGWFGLDPTNNLLADERHIKIATGRDYDNAAPVRGTFVGPVGVTAMIDVKVEVGER